MDYPDSKSSDKILGILLIFIFPLILLIIGAIINKMYLVGIPYIIYGIYGLVSKRMWLPLPWPAPLFAKANELEDIKKKYFRLGKEAIKISIIYIVMGSIIMLVFYGLWLYVLYQVPEIVNYL